MSDECVDNKQDDLATPRVLRRETLKGLGALAVTSTAFAAVGCGSDATNGVTMAGESGAAAATNTAASNAAASAGAGTAQPSSTGGSPASMSASTRSMTSSQPMAASAGSAGGATTAASGGSSAPAASGGATASGAAGAPAAGATASSAGAGGAVATATTDLSSLACILSPDMTEGPFFVDEKLNRSDLLMGETDESIVMATPLALTIGVYKVDGMACMPLSGLQVDIWHADALGLYSDVASGFVQATDTRGKKFLRAYQVTNESGWVQFATIYPGWYMSRTIHIHFKIRMPMGGTTYDFTSQMFFDEKVSEEVLASGPYAKAPGNRSVLNEDDHIFQGTPQNGQQPPAGQKAPGLDTMVALSKAGNGYTGLLKIGLKI